MKRLKLERFLLFFIILTLTKPAWAYLDPGSVSLFLQGILAAVAAGIATFRLWWHKVKSLFMRNKDEDDS